MFILDIVVVVDLIGPEISAPEAFLNTLQPRGIQRSFSTPTSPSLMELHGPLTKSTGVILGPPRRTLPLSHLRQGW